VLRLLGVAAALLLATAASAMGQAAVDQYLPSAKPGGHHGSAAGAIDDATGPTGPSAQQAEAKAKKRQASVANGSATGPPDDSGGFSLTPFVIIVIALFLAGVAARYLPRLYRRLRPAHPA
jgi:hypothetical protein